MAELQLAKPEQGKSIEETVSNLLSAYYILIKNIQNNFAYCLDSDNVTEINTNLTRVKSNKGTTVIEGPLLEMYDMQSVPVERLKQGYDIATSDFVFELYNKAGAKTVGIDSNGNATLSKVTLRNDLTGNAYIQIDSSGFKANNGSVNTVEVDSSGNATLRKVTLRNDLSGTAYVQIDSSGFRANDGLKNTVEIDSLGKAYFRGDVTSEANITGATIRSGAVGTARIELSGGKFRGLTANEDITGLYFDINQVPNTGIVDIGIYHNGTRLMEFYDGITYSWIKPINAGITIGDTGFTTTCKGSWNIPGYATDSELSNAIASHIAAYHAA